MFFSTCRQLDAFFAWDSDEYPFTEVSIEFFQRAQQGRFVYLEGDLAPSIAEWLKPYSHKKCDLIDFYESDFTLDRLILCQSLAHSQTVLWIHHIEHPSAQKDLQEALQRGIIQIVQEFSCPSAKGKQMWIEARYVNR